MLGESCLEHSHAFTSSKSAIPLREQRPLARLVAASLKVTLSCSTIH